MEENYSLEKLQEEFSSFLQNGKKKASTIRQYNSVLRSLLTESVHQEVLGESQTTKKSYYFILMERLEQELYGNPKHTTRRSSFTLINTFIKFLEVTGKIPAGEYTICELPKQEKKPLVFMTEEEYKRLIKTAREIISSDASKKYRNARYLSAITLTHDTGATLSEIVNLEYDDLNLDEGYVRITNKDNKERNMQIAEQTLDCIIDYIVRHNRNKNKNSIQEGKLFRSENNDRIDPKSVRRRFKQYAKAAGLERWEALDLMSLRYTFAKEQIDKGTGVKELCNLLGIKEERAREIIRFLK